MMRCRCHLFVIASVSKTFRAIKNRTSFWLIWKVICSEMWFCLASKWKKKIMTDWTWILSWMFRADGDSIASNFLSVTANWNENVINETFAHSSHGEAQKDTFCRNERLITDWISLNKDPIKQVVYRKAYVSRLPFNLIRNGLWIGLIWTDGTKTFLWCNLRNRRVEK